MMYEPSNIIMILEILQKNGGFFFYNPINKRGVVGCKSELPEELGVTTLNESEISFYATLLYYTTDEAKEGRDAFKEKRKPDFKQFPKFP